MVNRENINSTILKNGFSGEIDLLTIDIDGIDFWVLDAIHVVWPRVVIVEINPIFGERSITIPYKDNFIKGNDDYYGASLMAYYKMMTKKGYRLIGTNSYGFNAFFIREDIARGTIQTVYPEDCRSHLRFKEDYYVDGFNRISHLTYHEV